MIIDNNEKETMKQQCEINSIFLSVTIINIVKSTTLDLLYNKFDCKRMKCIVQTFLYIQN